MFYADSVPGWDEAVEREVLRAWLATMPESERTPWLAFCLGAARYRLVADEQRKEQQRSATELRERIQHLERKLSWLEPDASRWLADLTQARARIIELEQELRRHGHEVPAPVDRLPPDEPERILPRLS